MTRTILRSTAALTIAAAAAAASALPASAHVRVIPENTSSGSWTTLTFRVPNESDTASTTKLEVTLPQDRPLASVSVRPVEGWSAKVTNEKLPTPVTAHDLTLTEAPRTVVWTADSTAEGIAPGEYQEFSISAGPLPTPGTLTLPAEQTYSDGEVADWAQAPQEGGQQPEYPAPTFEVTAAAEDDGHHGADEGGEEVAAPADEAESADEASDTTARVLGGLALLVALVGVGVAVIARRRA